MPHAVLLPIVVGRLVKDEQVWIVQFIITLRKHTSRHIGIECLTTYVQVFLCIKEVKSLGHPTCCLAQLDIDLDLTRLTFLRGVP